MLPSKSLGCTASTRAAAVAGPKLRRQVFELNAGHTPGSHSSQRQQLFSHLQETNLCKLGCNALHKEQGRAVELGWKLVGSKAADYGCRELQNAVRHIMSQHIGKTTEWKCMICCPLVADIMQWPQREMEIDCPTQCSSGQSVALNELLTVNSKQGTTSRWTFSRQNSEFAPWSTGTWSRHR